MKTIVTSKLLKRYLILAVMIVGLVFVASSDRYVEPVAAAPCCQGCPGGGDPSQVYAECSALCFFNPDPFCVGDCENAADSCYRRCTYCGGGGPPGGTCNSSTDCNINEFCAADNLCHPY